MALFRVLRTMLAILQPISRYISSGFSNIFWFSPQLNPSAADEAWYGLKCILAVSDFA